MAITKAKKVRDIAGRVAPLNPDLARSLLSIDAERARQADRMRFTKRDLQQRRDESLKLRDIQRREQWVLEQVRRLLRAKREKLMNEREAHAAEEVA